MTGRSVLVVGHGELGRALVATVRATTGEPPAVAGRARTGEAARQWRSAVEQAGGRPVDDLATAVAAAELVLACVPAAAAGDVARSAAPHLRPGSLWADLSSAAPAVKEAAAEVVGRGYVDAAVLGAVAASGGAVPVLAAGEQAAALVAAATGLGLVVEALPGPAGTAARVKLLRSVYMKGRDALVAEMMLAARRAGVADVVAGSIRGPGEEVPFPELARRVLGSLERHADRRADELADACALLRDTGVAPVAAEGAQERLRRFAAGER